MIISWKFEKRKEKKKLKKYIFSSQLKIVNNEWAIAINW